VRQLIGNFVEVHVRCPLSECERRDIKGLYAKARAGQIESFTGVTDPYEAPEAPELVLDTLQQTPEESVHALLECLQRLGHVSPLAAAGRADAS
jgi:adenylylsulfate kinase-like enzyme